MSFGLEVSDSNGNKTVEIRSHLLVIVALYNQTNTVSAASYSPYEYVDYLIAGFDPNIPGHSAIIIQSSHAENFFLELSVGKVRCIFKPTGDYGYGTVMTCQILVFK